MRASIGNGSTVSSSAGRDIVLGATDASFIDARGIAGALSITGGEGGAVALGISIASDEPRNKRENWRKAFVTNMASAASLSVNPNSSLQVTLDASSRGKFLVAVKMSDP